MFAVALQFIARHWKWFAGGFAILALVVGFQLVQSQRNAARKDAIEQRERAARIEERLKVSNASIATLSTDLDKQNAAIDALGANGDARRNEAVANLIAEVKRGSKAAVVAAELSRKPQAGGDQSKTSATVLANKDLL